ncbi:glycosyltransferase family 4 protein [Neolewinella persica]|uniref:glycosyltransferase family 4 protein n=1 Tax=Neolewinella persica TaxID=70998 RepID=UPI000371C8AE|nr:glycosyltransferase family 4 protein [Neolewinella persica]
MATIAVISNTAWSLINFRTELINALRRDGHTVFTVAPPDKYVDQLREMSDGFYPLKHLAAKGKNPYRDMRLLWELHKMYLEKRIDIAFTFTAKPNIYGSFATQYTKVMAVPTINGLGNTFIRFNLTQLIMRKLYKSAFKYTSKVIFQNPDDRNLFLEKSIVKKEQCLLSNGSGVNLETFRAKNNKIGRPLAFLLSARLVREKGIFEYLKAARRLNRKGVAANFYVLGLPSNNPSSIRISELEEYTMAGDIDYLGHTDKMSEELDKVDVLVLPSYYREGVPRVLLEGLAKGLPIITTDSVGCRETIIDGKNGVMIEPRNTDALVKAIEVMIDSSEEELQEMGRQSRLLAEDKFDVNKVVAIYRSLL